MRYFQPEMLKDLLLILDHEDNCMIIAGGTDLVIYLQDTVKKPDSLIDVTNVKDLIGIKKEKSGITIGSATTISNIAASNILPECLRNGAGSIGSPQIRNLATIGGNICNASPCGDTLAPLLSLKADFLLQSVNSERLVPADQFFIGPKKTVMQSNEILSEIRISSKYLDGISDFKMIGQRNGQVISQVNLAIWLKTVESTNIIKEIRISAGSVAPTPVRIIKAEKLLCNKVPTPELILEAGKLVQSGICPIDDVRSTAIYRQDVIAGLFQDIMTHLLNN